MQKQKVVSGIGETATEEEGTVHVTYGSHVDIPVSAAGKTVAEVRRVLTPLLNIDPQAEAYVDGKEVEEEHILEGGVHLEFLKQLGRRGYR